MGHVTLLAAFVAGLLSFISPCVLPLTPIYMARLVGPGIWQSQQVSDQERNTLRRVTIIHALAFIGGFTVTFIALGATASELGSFLSANQAALREIGGVILVILGAHVAGLIHIPGLDVERRFSVKTGKASYPASFLIGLIFALGWAPCVGPILALILVLAAQAGTLGAGVLLLAIYSIGLGIPFLALGIAFDRMTPLLKRLRPYMQIIEWVTGALLAFMGVAIFFNWLFYINSYFNLPGLG
ncbi:MAG TPA: cytochrome c biogenesis CcdA family protein [Ktedonobacterales bacterium]|nr:cytochrome c biogenesis CcdA family protein [Ktedonobacterales bacterium]